MAIHFALVPPGAPVEFDGKMRQAILLVPDVEYITKFANGELGIGMRLEQIMVAKNLSVCKTPETFSIFAKLAKISLPNPAESYFKNGKAQVDPKEVPIGDENSLLGLRAMERAVIQSILESQKPYIDIAMILIKNLVRIEDIIARVLAIADASQIPKTNPKALGYAGSPVTSTIGKVNNLKSKKTPRATSNSSATNNSANSQTGTNATQTNNPTNAGNNGEYNYEIISTVYSTGEFKPEVKYDYQYIDIISDNIDPNSLTGDDPIDDSFDPYDGLRPKTVVFGIYKSDGSPIDPPDWLVRSGKWFGHFPYISEVNYIWQRGPNILVRPGVPEEQYTGDNRAGWEKKKYTGGRRDGLDIAVFSPTDKQKYLNYFREYLQTKLDKKPELTTERKTNAINKAMAQVDIQEYLESINGNGFLSNLKLVSGSVPMSKTPYDARKVNINGNDVWIDPETEYDMKVIKIDSTINITYLNVSQEPEISTQIIRFVKNTLSIVFSQGESFNIKYLNKNNLKIDERSNITEFVLDNWNWDDPDQSPGGALTLNPSNKYDILITRNLPQDKHKNGISWFDTSSGVKYHEVVKDNQTSKYSYYLYDIVFSGGGNTSNTPNGEFDVDGGPIGVTKIYVESGKILKWYIGTSVSYDPPGVWSEAGFKYTWSRSSGANMTEYNVFSKTLNIVSKQGTKSLSPQPANIYTLNDGTKISVKSNGEIEYWYVYEGQIDTFLPNQNKKNIITFRASDNVPNTQTVDLPPNQIRVKADTNPYGKLISQTQVTNSHLATTDLYSKGFYGSSSETQKQDIQQIYRYMRDELDTETFYIVEGILPDENTQSGVGGSSGQGSGSGQTGERYYKKVNALGAIKPFISILADIFTKLIPGIEALLDLFTNPASFITNILTEKLQDNFLFISKDFVKDYGKLLSMNPLKRKDFVKGSQLKNYVYVDDKGDFKFLLDGSAVTKLFNITFGLELKNLLFKLIFKKDPTAFKDTLNSLLGLPNQGGSVPGGTKNSSNVNMGQNQQNSTNQIKTQSGENVFIDEVSIQYSTGVFVEGVDYEYIYVTEYIQNLIKEADDLVETGDPDNIEKAIANYEQALQQDPKNKFIKDKLDALKKAFQTFTQPILDFLLSLVTLPIKIVKGIIEYIMSVFSSLNLAELPSKIAEFIQFKWIMKFFDPMFLLGLAGIKFDIPKFNGWVRDLKSFPKDHIFDLSEIIDLPFMPKLFKVNKEQFLSLLITPLKMIWQILCLIEALINAIINFIWAILSLYVIIPPPHIKLCNNSNDNMTIQDLVQLLSGGFTNAGNNPITSTNPNAQGEGNPGSSYNFIYDIKLPDGRNIQDLNREELQKWLDENKDLRVIFNF